jgi:long-subunit fatty acid transport protein
MFVSPSSADRRSLKIALPLAMLCLLAAASPERLTAQGSATLGNGLSAAAIGRGGTTVAQRSGPLDAMEGNPAGLAGTQRPALDLGALGLVVGGSFENSVNPDARPTGVAGALPYGAFALPLRTSPWTAAFAVTPEILVRANWHYLDAPGTAGVTYGYQVQEDQIIAIRSALGIARPLGSKWSVGATLGLVYNTNNLNAPYIFQQQPQLAGLKVLLSLGTHGYGWNGGAGLQWQPSTRLHAGLAWKSGTTLRTQGTASGTASALFDALGVTANPAYTYHAQVENHLPQAFDAGVSWQTSRHMTLAFQTDFTAWGQAFQDLPIKLTNGSNATINSVVGSSTIHDDVPLHWSNQAAFHGGIELPVAESWAIRAGFSHANDPVPNATLTPLTAAVMQNAVAAGTGYTHGRWHYDAAYQAQLPATRSVSQSALKAGEYSDSRVRIFTQSLTLTARARF